MRSAEKEWRVDAGTRSPAGAASRSGGSRDRFGSDLSTLVSAVGVPLARAVRITGLPSGTLARATFRLDFRDGRRLKGRRLDQAIDAERIETLVGCVGLPTLPRVLARSGTALLEEWVTGVPLDRVRLTPLLVRRAGELLGAIHRARPLKTSSTAAPPSPAKRLASTDRGLDELGAGGLLSSTAVRRLRRLAQAHVPRRPEVGLVHRDFCLENLVLDRAGILHIVDNGTVTVDALDFDLARTWYRWPMTPARRRTFLAGYLTHRNTAAYLAHRWFWRVAVLVEAALFRYRARTPDRHLPERRLLQILRTPTARQHA